MSTWSFIICSILSILGIPVGWKYEFPRPYRLVLGADLVLEVIFGLLGLHDPMAMKDPLVTLNTFVLMFFIGGAIGSLLHIAWNYILRRLKIR